MPALLRRILLAPLLRLLWTGILGAGLFRLLVLVSPSTARLPNVTLGGALRNALMTLLVFVLSLWLLEGKRPRDAGLAPSRALPDTLRGFLLGAALLTAVVGVLALVGSYRIIGWAPVPDGTTRTLLFGRLLFILLCVGVFEELASRGIFFRLLEQGLGTWLAVILSGALFGLGHLNNPGATWVSSLAIAVGPGALLAAAYVATRSLWIPIGLHWAWNLFEGPVWGTPVSGMATPVLAVARLPGSTALTGGDFGPEAGLPCIVLATALAVAFFVLAIRRHQIVTPSWMWWIAGRLRRTPPALPAPPASAPAPAVPPSSA
ncbi:MAG: CPBP family intramembrane glutamic endopeptidase [Myxococcaceae bacterium]